ncbi:hypothetical protein ACFOUP_07920 [Belliella kenyensis]|uniref:HPt domain-containing protein n=1 Tax=Belliella kenyensis TaxID=1472724 RepID=A0ABV8EKX3_9BACT|nr:hypothetical protein [Belliella kenyensis]MCH7400402.1 hypothetical protein [Belliella kenyensis]MDN3604580.1 hypothetical protein [Belliella kenyensis]
MNNIEPINLSKIDEMAEGDLEFKNELVSAIYTSLIDLRTKYIEGSEKEENETIQQIRHKVKPTLALFEIRKLEEVLSQGKLILEKNGFKGEFLIHLETFLDTWEETYEYLRKNVRIESI